MTFSCHIPYKYTTSQSVVQRLFFRHSLLQFQRHNFIRRKNVQYFFWDCYLIFFSFRRNSSLHGHHFPYENIEGYRQSGNNLSQHRLYFCNVFHKNRLLAMTNTLMQRWAFYSSIFICLWRQVCWSTNPGTRYRLSAKHTVVQVPTSSRWFKTLIGAGRNKETTSIRSYITDRVWMERSDIAWEQQGL